MDDDNCPQIDVDEETYESKALAAYLVNEISAEVVAFFGEVTGQPIQRAEAQCLT
ncbi:MAG TPA: hypothetical protein VF503_07425 [Sphingobium sp.]|uniref:hypothetical protein n=1 Tax=Sphingobium sp. TaxID=1912891 RepID=UPI002ED06B6E